MMKLYVVNITGTAYQADTYVYGVYDNLAQAQKEGLDIIQSSTSGFHDKGWIEVHTLNEPNIEAEWISLEVE